MPITIVNKVRVPVYRTQLWIVITTNISVAIEEIEDEVDHRIADKDNRISIRAYCYGYIDPKGRQKIILFLRPTASPGEIAHEVNHAMNIIFGWHGVRLSTTNDEPQSYYLERLINKVHYAIKSFKRLTNSQA